MASVEGGLLDYSLERSGEIGSWGLVLWECGVTLTFKLEAALNQLEIALIITSINAIIVIGIILVIINARVTNSIELNATLVLSLVTLVLLISLKYYALINLEHNAKYLRNYIDG